MATASFFHAPVLKAQWGATRTRELADALEQFAAQKPYKTVPVHHGLGVEYVGQFPPHIPLILGDAIHNLRTALDLLACDVVRQNNASAKGVYFPFAHDENGLETQIKEKKFHRASPEAIELEINETISRRQRTSARAA